MKVAIDDHIVDVFVDGAYSLVDSVHKYDSAYFENANYECSSIIGIKIHDAETLLKSVVIGASGGSTGIYETSFVYEPDRITICCSDTVFCLSIPELSLLWKTKADSASCFEIFKYKTDYIVHGELEITRLGNDGKIVWQNSGADIFTTLNSTKEDFVITQSHILATDWENNKYKFDFDGNLIS